MGPFGDTRGAPICKIGGFGMAVAFGKVRLHSSIPTALGCEQLLTWNGVLRHSNLWPLRHLSFRLRISTLNTALCSMSIEKGGPSHQSSRTSIRDVVNECSPGGGARLSNPHAASISTVVLPPSLGAELAAAQQSRRRRTLDLHLSNRLWICDQSTVGLLGSAELMSPVSSACLLRWLCIPCPCRLAVFIYKSMPSIV
jgi:hypothetical protein